LILFFFHILEKSIELIYSRMALNYYKNELKENAQLLASKGKGILAVDESTKTVGKRLADWR
jgi:hypothetical protein